MEIESKIDKRLWDAVGSDYESHNFTGAIQSSVYFISELIRVKSGLEGDGISG